MLSLLCDLRDVIPEAVDLMALKLRFRTDENPLNVVLVQELARYNVLLKTL